MHGALLARHVVMDGEYLNVVSRVLFTSRHDDSLEQQALTARARYEKE